jgi:hypothetical protein
VSFLRHLCKLAITSAIEVRAEENAVTLEELDHNLPNGFHDAQIFSFGRDYAAGIAKFHLNLLVGWPNDPAPDVQARPRASIQAIRITSVLEAN